MIECKFNWIGIQKPICEVETCRFTVKMNNDLKASEISKYFSLQG